MDIGAQLTRMLKSRHAVVLTLVLVAQMAFLYGYSRQEAVPTIPPLATFPKSFPNWQLLREGVVEDEVLEVLKADDTLTRYYGNGSVFASLFIAYFKTQRTGQVPHSPKHCLPGSGWTPSESSFLPIEVSGMDSPITVNRYVVSRGEDSSLVLYWYQSLDRVVASEYMAKFYLVTDSIRYNRTDTALVRVVVPVAKGDPNGVADAEAAAVSFVKEMFPAVKPYFPPTA